MQPALTFFFMLLFVLLCLLGLLANGFIVLTLSRERMCHGRLLPSDLILLCLAVSRFFLQWVGMVNSFYGFLHFMEYRTVRQFFGLQWDFLNTATYWFGTWLSVLFCLKVANISHPAFLWLKWRFLGSLPWLLLSTLLISSLVTLLFFWGNHELYQGFLSRRSSDNMTYREWSRRLELSYFLPLKLVTLSIPCSIFLLFIVLLISSLRVHMGRMRPHFHSLQDPYAQAHTRALTSLISFLVLYALSFVSLIIDILGFFSIESDWYWPWQNVIYLCISVHPLILILSNPRLQGMYRHLLLLARGLWES
ncbi:taste receptor type 2 member 41-like [Suncus etruscus]|uniref:taste receptor type 2 member 41-like n=1 Tax=Suncus etruscus TaxID=109475 RepID=UPI002110D370|nr:taste receptor type 2 member 41-like [Suncus etruscus]